MNKQETPTEILLLDLATDQMNNALKLLKAGGHDLPFFLIQHLMNNISLEDALELLEMLNEQLFLHRLRIDKLNREKP